MSAKDVVIGDTRKHAQAMIHWMKMDPKRTVALAYGDPLPEKCGAAHLIRPLAGPTDEHFAWIAGVVKIKAASLATLAASWGAAFKPTLPLLPAPGPRLEGHA